MAVTENLLEKSTTERLGELLNLLNIKEAFYVDDYNGLDNLGDVQTVSKLLFNEKKIAELKSIFGEDVNYEVPTEDEFGPQIAVLWEEANSTGRAVILEAISKVQQNAEEFNTIDFVRTRELQNMFPAGQLILKTPDDWAGLLATLSAKYTGEEKVLILFDQDLKKAVGARFKNGDIQGQNLIVEIKKSAIGRNVYCGLITHLIQDTSKEIDARDAIITASGGSLTKTDFLALSKERIANSETFCDGIKKTLLNGYFEIIKEKSKSIIENAHKNALTSFDKLDTYDFDHTILQSSFAEGVWEANTIFRITNNLFEENVKELMVKGAYPKEINPILKFSKKVSDITFKLPNAQPYIEKYTLRHKDIYEPGRSINELHSPIENGDVFEIVEGTKKGFYILIGQECDLMVRNNGKRIAEITTLVKITSITKDELKHHLSNSDNYLANKFPLYYFTPGTTDIGVVNFNNTYDVNLDVLDLCVFNLDGSAKLDITSKFDVDLLNISWENRYNTVIRVCSDEAKKLEAALNELKGIQNLKAEIRNHIYKKIYPNLGAYFPLGIQESYNANVFDFGLKRIMRLKNFDAKYLLDRYYKHMSRTAEQHDFAK